MSVINVDRLLEEISPKKPCGDNLELERTSLEVEISGLESNKKEPDWSEIQRRVLELLARTHDLGLAMYLTRALLHNDGLVGLREGLQLLQGLISRCWETVYPLPEDTNDPYERINVLELLDNREAIIQPLMNATLCSAPPMGHFCLRDIRIAKGETAGLVLSEKEQQDLPNDKTIDAAFMTCDLENLKATRACVATSLASLASLETQLAEKIGPERQAIDFGKLRQVLEEMDVLLAQQLDRREPATHSAPKHPDVSLGIKTVDAINNRKDVIRILEMICVYYELNEPSSPVPLLLKRAIQLVEKNFLEIIKDLAPGSVDQIKVIGGVKEDKG